jgi:serine/threonine protein kinase/tetratricopeptide (TPR) repeat protein
MNPSPEREKALLEALTKLPPAQHRAYLESACAGNPSLLARLQAKLEPQSLPHSNPKPTIVVSFPGEEKNGDRIGHYKLLQKIGEGGMGAVWLAEQIEPVRRQVALKVIKQGMDSGQVLARFEAERQALALMDHPNIARVLDAGATPTGRPYFVMELVKGTSLTRFCDDQRLSIRDRLRLFIPVCQAVQHAHQKGIIHRDLKPSNILVALYDGKPVPKVIDFGVAKATGARLTERTLFTELGAIVGTLEYMSPEQAELNQLDIDTRSDIYSLGVVLYELLTGSTPLTRETLRQGAFDEILRRIREEEPPRPSTRLSESKAQLPAISAQRQLQPEQLTSLLRGDLDWIVMKTLEKDRARRYETANGVAMDLQRHLSDEPVAARPPSAAYRLQKTMRRHKLAFVAGGAVALSLVIGFAVALWLFLAEKRAERVQAQLRQQAEAESAKSRQVAQFLKDMLKGVGPSVALGRDTAMLREISDRTVERLGKDLAAQPLLEAELRATIGQVYWALGDNAKAEPMHREALAVRRRLLGEQHPDVAQSMNDLGKVLWSAGKMPEAEKLHRQALALRRKLGADAATAESLNNLALVLYSLGRAAEAEALGREAVQLRRKLFGPDHPDLAESLGGLAAVLWGQGKLPEAETAYREALAAQRKSLGHEHPDIATSLNNLGTVLWSQGKLAESETLQREALAMYRKLFGNEHPEVATSLNNLALVLWRQGKLEDSEPMFREALTLKRKLLGDHQDVASLLNNLAFVLWKKGQLTEAESLNREALAMRKQVLGDDSTDAAASLDNLGSVLRDARRLPEAEAALRECLAIREKKIPDDWRTFGARNTLGGILAAQSKWAEAEPLLLSAYEGLKKRETKIPAEHKTKIKEAAEHLAQLFEATGRADQAAEWKKKAAGP